MNGSTSSCLCSRDHRRVIEARIAVIESGCWEWTSTLDRKGYGRLHHRGFHFAHRFSYEAFVGKIPAGLTIDHLCRNRKCVNPRHLEPVTDLENIARRRKPESELVRPRRDLGAPRRAYRSRENVTEDDPRHGTRTGYVGLHCRCERCTRANREYRQKAARHVERMARADGCPECVVNVEVPRSVVDTDNGFRAAYLCGPCGHAWTTDWREDA